MAEPVRLSTPRFRVVMGDDTVHEAQAINADLVAYDMTRSRHKWPDAQEAPMLWQTFVSWRALRRLHLIPDELTWETYRDTTQEIAPLGVNGAQDDLEADAVGPTHEAAVPT
jgi:hypothetical protein